MQDDPQADAAAATAPVFSRQSPGDAGATNGDSSLLPGTLAVVRHMPAPVVVLDASKRIRGLSRMAEEVLGLKSEDLVGRDANRALELSSKEHERQWSADDKVIDTRFGNGRRVVFDISHVYGDDDENLTSWAADM